MSDLEKRRTAFAVGEHYRVLHDAPPDFKAGERLRLKEFGYSRYDEAHVYVFQTDGGELKKYWLSDNDPVEQLTSTFA
jgi:hypothetical protein